MTQPVQPALFKVPTCAETRQADLKMIRHLQDMCMEYARQIDRLVELLGYDPVLMEQDDPAAGLENDNE